MSALSKHIYFTILATWFATLCVAQSPHPSFRQYTVEDGLPSSEVYQVKQDSKGYIWFATGNGVSRFDGYRFENFSLDDGLPDNTVFEIYEDRAGRIWFLTLSCQLAVFINGKIYPYPHNTLIRESFPNAIKTSFYVNDTGSVLMGLANHGIYEITPRGQLLTHTSRETFNGSYDVIGNDLSQLSYYGICWPGQEPVAHFRIGSLEDTVTLGKLDQNIGLFIFRLLALHDGAIAFTYGNVLYMRDKTGRLRQHKLEKRINWIYEDRDRDLWIGMCEGGVLYIQNRDFLHAKSYLSTHSVDGVWEDREGGFWFATEDAAVFYTPSKRVFTLDKNAGLSDDQINSLCTDGERIFAGTRGGWLYAVSEDLKISGLYLASDQQKIGDIPALYYNEDKEELWVSGRGKVLLSENGRLDPVSSRPYKFNRVVKDGRGDYWGGVAVGLFCFPDSTRNLQYVRRVNGMLMKGPDRIWLGTIGGLWQFDTRTNKAVDWSGRHPLLKHRILDLEYIGDSVLVIASKGAGVLLMDRGQVWQIDTRKGLCDNTVNGIFVDGNTIWAATTKGLNKIDIDPERPPGYRVDRYTTLNGLASNEVKDVIRLKDRVWVATQKGLSFFNPGEKQARGVERPTYLNRIWIDDRPAEPKPGYELGYGQNRIRIDFTGLGYRDNGNLAYRYRMLGLDNRWNYTDNREIQFTTLPGGDYRFEVSTRNADGSWSREKASVRFVVVTPFWKRWWFQALAVLLSGVLIAWVVRHRFRVAQREKERDDELNRNLLSLRLKALRAQMNPHFTFNVMNSIQHFILNKEEESAHRYLSKFSRLIRLILNNSETDTVSLREERKALELYLELESMRFDHAFGYGIYIDPSIDTERTRVPSMLIQPYVENAILHGLLPSAREARIDIRILRDGDFLKCVIEDNGIGRVAAENKKDKQYRSFGTSITKERLSAINSMHNNLLAERISDLYDGEGRPTGTRVEIYIPLINSDENESDYY